MITIRYRSQNITLTYAFKKIFGSYCNFVYTTSNDLLTRYHGTQRVFCTETELNKGKTYILQEIKSTMQLVCNGEITSIKIYHNTCEITTYFETKLLEAQAEIAELKANLELYKSTEEFIKECERNCKLDLEE